MLGFLTSTQPTIFQSINVTKRGISMTQEQLFSQDRDVDQTLLADVLVIGGGPAGTWSAWSAANAG
ncbi:MAG: hypothetical protein AN487_14800, partial [Anabaena sp. CRKS33]